MEAEQPGETSPELSADITAEERTTACGSSGQTGRSDPDQGVWHAPRELGLGRSGLASLGQGTVATLAGFDLASVVLLSIGHTSGWAQQAAIACLGVAAAVLVLALAFIASAGEYSATPDERLMYRPEARVSKAQLDVQRGLQRQDSYLFSVYCNERVLRAVNSGVLFTLAGLALTVFTTGLKPGPMIAAAAAIIVGVIYVIDWRKRGSNWWLFPRPMLPDWTRERWNATNRDRPNLSKKQIQRDEMLHCPVASSDLSPAGRAAMLPRPALDED